MSHLTYFHVGRTTLWRGAPLRVAVRVERGVDAESLLPLGSFPSVTLQLRLRNGEGEEGEGEVRKAIGDLGERTFKPAVEGDVRHELPTDELPAGPLELTFRVGAGAGSEALLAESIEEVSAPELILILERSEYRELVDERLEEPFLPSVGLEPEQVVDLVGELMHDLLPIAPLRHDFEERARTKGADEAEQATLPPPQPHGLWPWEFVPQVLPGEALFPEDPIRWVTAKLLETVNDLQVNGFSAPPRIEITVDPSVPAVWVIFELSLEQPVSEALARSLTDPELSDLAQVRRGVEEAQVDDTIVPNRSAVKIGVTLPTGGFAIEEK
jgi:hypothetical protein